MHNILLLVGIILVTVSIFIIYQKGEDEKAIYIEIQNLHEEIIDYVEIMEDILKDLDILIDNSLKKIEEVNEYEAKLDDDKNTKPIFFYDENNSNLLDEEVVNLAKHGYSKKEIAKKLNKGRREIDIILKMYNRSK